MKNMGKVNNKIKLLIKKKLKANKERLNLLSFNKILMSI
jgi:hypothetical protein